MLKIEQIYMERNIFFKLKVIDFVSLTYYENLESEYNTVIFFSVGKINRTRQRYRLQTIDHFFLVIKHVCFV
jgi:hypothetical protein